MNLKSRPQSVTERNEVTEKEATGTTLARKAKPTWTLPFRWVSWLLKRTWRGAVWGAVLSTGLFLFLNLWPQHLGRGSFLPDLLIPLLLVGGVIFLSGALVDLAWLLIRLFSRLVGWFLQKTHLPEKRAQLLPRAVKAVPVWFVRGAGCVLLLFAIFYFVIGQQGAPSTLLWMFVAFETVCGALFGAALPLPVKSGSGFIHSSKTPSKKAAALAGVTLSDPPVPDASSNSIPGKPGRLLTPAGLIPLALPLVLNLSLVAWLIIPGSDDYLVRETPPTLPVAQLSLPNPGQPGPFKVETFFYGSGTDQHRPQYASGVVFKTLPVDASKLLPEWSGFYGSMLDWAWGFSSNALPVNAQVWYPAFTAQVENTSVNKGNQSDYRLKIAEQAGSFPLVLLVHGNHAMLDIRRAVMLTWANYWPAGAILPYRLTRIFSTAGPLAILTIKKRRSGPGCCYTICGTGKAGMKTRLTLFTTKLI